MADPIIIAVPKGRALTALVPIFDRMNLKPDPAFEDPDSRLLRFATNRHGIEVIRIREFDVATFVAHGAAQVGIVSSDVLMEFGFSEIYAPIDLGIARGRVCVIAPSGPNVVVDNPELGHLRVATKYPNLTRKHFAARGIQAECVELNGALEIAPVLGLANTLVDLVASGRTLRAHGLTDIETILDVSTRLIVNRTMFKRHHGVIASLIEEFRQAAEGVHAV